MDEESEMKKPISHLAIALAVAIAPGGAGAVPAFVKQDVVPLNENVFEVTGRVGATPGDYWCGAADFAQRYLDAGATDRIYIWRGLGPSQSKPGKTSVQFSFSPPAGAQVAPGYSLSVKTAGDSLTTSAAIQYCFDLIFLEI
jgi:hypothetical protein